MSILTKLGGEMFCIDYGRPIAATPIAYNDINMIEDLHLNPILTTSSRLWSK